MRRNEDMYKYSFENNSKKEEIENFYRVYPGGDEFVFIIEGAFEVQNRLLEARDGLSLWNLSKLEFEALSNDAILMIIEVGMG